MPKEYTNGEITVVWKPDLCIHSANCVEGLGSVFNSEARPWINMNGATSEQIVSQVAKCPSGALSIKENNSKPATNMSKSTSNVTVFTNGPLRVAGPCEIAYPDGKTETIEKDVFLCRCGQSSNKPFCDGTHKKHGFIG